MRHRLLNVLLAAVMAATVSVSPAWCAEKKAADASTESVEALIDLLKAKGVLREDEVREFKNRLRGGAASEAARQAPAAPAPHPPPPQEASLRKARVPDEDIKAMIESLKNQGLLGGGEAAGLMRRLAPMESEKDEAERAKPVVLEGSNVPHVRSTMPEAYLAAMIHLLKAQGVAAPGEAEVLNRRLSRKMAADEKSRAAEAGVASISSQIEQLQARGVIGGEQASALLANLKETVGVASPAAADAGTPVAAAGKPPTGVPEPKTAPAPAGGASMRLVSGIPRMPADDLKGMVDSLKDQGLLSIDEAAGLKLRFAPDAADPAVMAERRKPVILEGRQVPYSRTTMPEAYIRAMVGILQRQGVLLRSEADVLQARFEAKAETDRLSEGIAREVTKNVREQLKKEVREEVVREEKRNPIPDWTKRIRMSGDIRLRFESDMFDPTNFPNPPNPSSPSSTQNTTVNRERLRLRTRLATNIQVADQVEAVFRLATGSLNNPVSTNQTFGDYWSNKSFLLDQAFLRWTPTPGMTIWGGRMPNPWFSTDLVWDPDLNFDGIAASYSRQVAPKWGGFLTAGVFPLQEVESSGDDKWLFGAQIGAQYRPRPKVDAKIGVGFYDFENIVGKPNDPSTALVFDYSAPLFLQKGNSLFDIETNPANPTKLALASKFRELNVTFGLDLGFWDPVHVLLVGDYVRNIAFNRNDIARRAGFTDNTNMEVLNWLGSEGWQVGVAVGYPVVKKYGDWKGSLFYKRLETDAVIDSFTDSDFHLGGTNAAGWILSGEYGLTRNIATSAKWISANEIVGFKIGVDVLLVDLNVRF